MSACRKNGMQPVKNAMQTPDSPPFIRKQYEFTAHIRDPEAHAAPAEIEDRRMAIYRELFYNNVENFIATGFPILRSLYSDEQWHAMVRDFFSRHQCKTPYFLEISQEFLAYLEHERAAEQDPPFLRELAHYEWTELALSISEEEIPHVGVDPRGDMMAGIPVLSPLAWLLSYQFDVHRIGPEYQPDNPPAQITTLLVYRDRHDEIGFMEINPVTAHLIQKIQLHPGMTGTEILEQIAGELNHPNPDVVINGGKEILEQLRAADILLGAKK